MHSQGNGKPPIIIVDDEPLLRMGFSIALETAGYSVKALASGQEALDYLQEHEALVVIADLRMPGMDGITMITRLREMGIKTPVVVCSANLDSQSTSDARDVGVDGFLRKPVTPAELRQAVEKLAG